MGCRDSCYARHAAEVREAFERFCGGCEPGDKETALMTLALSSVFRCPELTRAHEKRAVAVGAAREEVAEALLAAAAAGAISDTRLTKQAYDRYFDHLAAHFDERKR